MVDLAERVDQLAAEAFEADHSAATLILSRMASLLRALDTAAPSVTMASLHPAILAPESEPALMAG
ncbi:hypothetical protein WDZ11_16505 [Roseomonas mucosa]|uniref:Uncharacterized protein n=1 Tax=Roseomonas mucosa TaxID=207340 RepID=A0A1S8D9Z8_9PROT|nr:hypothetical protein [Roseomonas mucosa]ATR20983.1 hypothetical protein CTJ15_12195 [Roseomonas sp. FDAARGOS_362]ONH85171.1 hypothetical protein APZ41_000950 [Roseomonas mucosa]